MKITKLVAFGCSWTFGDELIDPDLKATDENIHACNFKNNNYRNNNCYAGIIANHYGFELYNTGFPGASLESMSWVLTWYLKNYGSENVMFLVGLTEPGRKSWFNPIQDSNPHNPPWNRHVHGTWLREPNSNFDDNWVKLEHTWLKCSHNHEWEEFNYRQTVNLFDHANSRYGIPVIQFNMLSHRFLSDCPTLINPNTDIKTMLLTQKVEPNKTYFAANRHPNEQGHQIIANHLINYIESSKILGC